MREHALAMADMQVERALELLHDLLGRALLGDAPGTEADRAPVLGPVE